jgi:antitoxin component YwqK of YwqJK toxin-antitoxin module
MREVFLSLLFSCFFLSIFAQGEYTVFYYENGQISSEGYMLDGVPNGYWKTYYPNGELKSEGNRKDLLLDSLWIFYSEEGLKLSETTFANDKKEGISRSYRDGVLYEEGVYSNNVKTGDFKIYYPSGEVHKTIPYENGQKVGLGYEYDREGMIITLMEYKEDFLRKADKINRYDSRGKKRGVWMEFHQNGVVAMEGYYSNGKKNGIFKTFDKKGDLLSLEKYRNDELVIDGEESVILDIRNTYFPDGTIKTSGGYVEGKKEGTHRIYDKEGNIVSAEIYSTDVKMGEGVVDKKGNFQGPWKLFYETGQLKAEGMYENSQREGDWTFYHKNGEIEHRAKYAEGKPQGVWKWYFDDKTLRRTEYYRRGKEDGLSEEYNEDGQLISKGEYVGGLKEGEWFYNVGDHTERGVYLDGERQGEWIYEYPDGELSYKGEYVVGLATGKHRWYHPNGQLKREGKYTSGVRVGTWNTYNEEGEKVLEVRYKNGMEHKINGSKVISGEMESIEEIP